MTNQPRTGQRKLRNSWGLTVRRLPGRSSCYYWVCLAIISSICYYWACLVIVNVCMLHFLRTTVSPFWWWIVGAGVAAYYINDKLLNKWCFNFFLKVCICSIFSQLLEDSSINFLALHFDPKKDVKSVTFKKNANDITFYFKTFIYGLNDT